MLNEKQKEQLQKDQLILKELFLSPQGQIALKLLKNKCITGVDFSQSNYLYYKEGQLSIIRYIEDMIGGNNG